MSDNILHVNDADFDAEVLASAEPVLVDFWAEWCGPCKMIAPMVDTLAGEYAGRAKVVKLNIESNPATGRKYGIRGIPTLLLFKDGKVEGTQVGAPGNIKTILTQMLDKAIA